MKLILTTLIMALNVSVAVAGPSTSGGIALEQTYEKCSNKKLGADLRVAAVASPKAFFGFLSEAGENYHTLKCVEGKNETSVMTGEEIVWKCSEMRAGEGQIELHINRSSAGVKYGILYRKNIIQQLQKMYRFSCDQTVSNK